MQFLNIIAPFLLAYAAIAFTSGLLAITCPERWIWKQNEFTVFGLATSVLVVSGVVAFSAWLAINYPWLVLAAVILTIIIGVKAS